MSAISIARPALEQVNDSIQRRHRLWITLGALASGALIVALCCYGFAYYTLSPAARVASAKHALLKPGGKIGHGLGILGGALLLLMYLYPLRKRWAWLSKKGKTANWLDYHILMGLTAPAIITFHSSFKFRGIAGAAYWMMIAVMLSGIAGRYLYGLIQRNLDQGEESTAEMLKLHRLFQLWHVIHRPFSYSMAILAILHVLVVMFLGYY